MKDKEHGFTLIELLVVVAVIGLLSSVVLASLNSAREKARDTRRAADIGQLQKALELYFHDNNQYPPHNSGTRVLSSLTELTTEYMPSLPEDPVAGDTSSGYRYRRGPATAYTMLVQFEGDDHSSWCGVSGGGGVSTWTEKSWFRHISHPDCQF